jgi:hypothetical protein
MKSFKEYISEAVYGKLATVYHRAMTLDAVKGIAIDGFRIGGGKGAMYGKAVYTTYELSSQLNPDMEQYGNLIIKSKVNLYGYLIFDAPVCKQVYGKVYSLSDQWTKFISKTSPPSVLEKIHPIKKGFSSGKALLVSKDRGIRKLSNGLIFTGRHDGQVCVIYEKKTVTPMSYNTTFNDPSILDDKVWTKVTRKTLVSKAMYNTLSKMTINVKKHNNNHLDEYEKLYEYIEDFIYDKDEDIKNEYDYVIENINACIRQCKSTIDELEYTGDFDNITIVESLVALLENHQYHSMIDFTFYIEEVNDAIKEVNDAIDELHPTIEEDIIINDTLEVGIIKDIKVAYPAYIKFLDYSYPPFKYTKHKLNTIFEEISVRLNKDMSSYIETEEIMTEYNLIDPIDIE